MTSVDVTRLGVEQRTALDNAVANARLEGVEIPTELQALAVAYGAGEIDRETFFGRARAFSGRLTPVFDAG